MARRIPDLKTSILIDLLKGGTSHLRMMDVTLPKHSGKVLAQKKLLSLSKKYSSILDKFLIFYPTCSELQKQKDSSDNHNKKKMIKRYGTTDIDKVVVKRRGSGDPLSFWSPL